MQNYFKKSKMSIILFLSFILTFWANLCAAHEEKEGQAGYPLYLTNASMPRVELEYHALDQCHQHVVHHFREASPFGLQFNLVEQCTDGILICYEGTLAENSANSTYGLVAGIQFNLPENKKHPIFAECNKNRKKECRGESEKCGAVWHGIRISTKMESGSDDGMKRRIMLELSISKHNYILGTDLDKFKLLFGNTRSLMTIATDEYGHRINSTRRDDLLWDAFLDRVPRGANAADYAGLWLLGMDLLPLLNQHSMKLHVYRSCGCEMHAWFIQPDDQFAPVQPALLPEMSRECTDNMDRSAGRPMLLPGPVSPNQAIQLRFRLNPKPKEIRIKLQGRDRSILFNMTIKSNGTAMESPHAKSIPIRYAMPIEFNTTYYMDVKICIRKYFYELFVRDRPAGTYFPWPDDWWTREHMGSEQIRRVVIFGDVYPSTIYEPELVESKVCKQDREKLPFIPRINGTNFNQRLKSALTDGDEIIFRGEIAENPRLIQFALLHDAPEWNKYIGAIPLRLILTDFQNGTFNLDEAITNWDNASVLKSHENVLTQQQDDEPFRYDFLQPRVPFESRFRLVNKKKLKKIKGPADYNHTIFFAFNNANNKTFNGTFETNDFIINQIHISGDLTLFELPRFNNSHHRFNKLSRVLTVGDTIKIEGKVSENATRVRIKLLHDSRDTKKYVGDEVLLIEFDSEKIQTRLDTVINPHYAGPKDAKKLSTTWSKLLKNNCRLHPGEHFKIQIHVNKHCYTLLVHGAFVANYTHVLPPWAVDHIQLDGMKGARKYVINRTAGMFPKSLSGVKGGLPEYFGKGKLHLPYVMAVAFPNMIRVGNSIRINGRVTSNNPTINIILLNEAVETYDTVSEPVRRHYTYINKTLKHGYPKIGKIVLHANFGKNHMKLSQRCKGTEQIPISMDKSELKWKNPLINGTKFELDIKIRGKRELELNLRKHRPHLRVKIILPAWAIGYIRIEGDLKLIGLPKIDYKFTEKFKPVLKEMKEN